MEGFVEAANAVSVVAVFTVWIKGDDVLLAKTASPLYTAVMVWVPRVSAALVTVACPLLPTAPVPSVELPSKNVTVPVGVPLLGGGTLTVAVKVMDWPRSVRLADE